MNLRKAKANMTKRLFQDNTIQHLETFLACKLISLEKLPWVRPIGTVEIWRRAIGKVVMKILKRDVLKATGSLNLYRTKYWQSSSYLLFTIIQIFNNKKIKAVLMVNASNAFNELNWEVFLHNTKITCPSVSTYINNCYLSPAGLYIPRGWSINQIYSLGITPLLGCKKSSEGKSASATKQVTFTDDLNGIYTVESLENSDYSREKRKKWLKIKCKKVIRHCKRNV